MGTSYAKADKAMHRMVDDIAAEFHERLIDHGVTLGVLWAFGGLMHQGMPAEAVVRIVGTRDRAAGLPDAQVVIDRDRWDELSGENRRALIDHELAHLLVVLEDFLDEAKKPVAKRDDNGRPKLRMRKHDAEVGFFFDVVERHKQHAMESVRFLDLTKRMTQLAFPWG